MIDTKALRDREIDLRRLAENCIQENEKSPIAYQCDIVVPAFQIKKLLDRLEKLERVREVADAVVDEILWLRKRDPGEWGGSDALNDALEEYDKAGDQSRGEG